MQQRHPECDSSTSPAGPSFKYQPIQGAHRPGQRHLSASACRINVQDIARS